MTSETPPDATRAGRRSQAQRREATREALLAAGRVLFAERGVDGVSAKELVTAAGVTRGALYHHFTNKQDLFRAVYERIEVELRDELAGRLDTVDDPLVALVTSIGWFLDICERPDVRRIGLVEAPAVLGWQTWREIENAHALGLIVDRLDAAARAGVGLHAPALRPRSPAVRLGDRGRPHHRGRGRPRRCPRRRRTGPHRHRGPDDGSDLTHLVLTRRRGSRRPGRPRAGCAVPRRTRACGSTARGRPA